MNLNRYLCFNRYQSKIWYENMASIYVFWKRTSARNLKELKKSRESLMNFPFNTLIYEIINDKENIPKTFAAVIMVLGKSLQTYNKASSHMFIGPPIS